MPSVHAPAYSIASTSNTHSEAPPYSAKPTIYEHTIESRTNSSYLPLTTSTYEQTEDDLSLALSGQVDRTEMPSYGRYGVVKGDLVLN